MQTDQFLAYWGWSSAPQSRPIELGDLFWQESTKSSIEKALFWMGHVKSLTIITAPIGHGKSTLSRWLYQEAPTASQDVFLMTLSHRQNHSNWLLPQLARYLGIEDAHPEKGRVIDALEAAQLRGRPLSIVIDDAHMLSQAEALDDISSLLKMQSVSTLPINFVLIGTPKIFHTVRSVESLSRYLVDYLRIDPLRPDEVLPYLQTLFKRIHLSIDLLDQAAVELIREECPLTFASAESLIQSGLVDAYQRDERRLTRQLIDRALKGNHSVRILSEAVEETRNSQKSEKSRRHQPSLQGKTSDGGTAAIDLNSLYYKSGDDHDPEDS